MCVCTYCVCGIFAAAPVIERLTRSPLTTVEGQEVTLQFRIHSNPPPHSLTFYHRGEVVGGDSRAEHGDGGTLLISAVGRSEERRVGKEC